MGGLSRRAAVFFDYDGTLIRDVVCDERTTAKFYKRSAALRLLRGQFGKLVALASPALPRLDFGRCSREIHCVAAAELPRSGASRGVVT